MSKPSKPEMERLSLSIEEFCALAGIGRTTAFKQIKLGHLRATKIGARTVIALDEARRFIAGRPVAHDGETAYGPGTGRRGVG